MDYIHLQSSKVSSGAGKDSRMAFEAWEDVGGFIKVINPMEPISIGGMWVVELV